MGWHRWCAWSLWSACFRDGDGTPPRPEASAYWTVFSVLQQSILGDPGDAARSRASERLASICFFLVFPRAWLASALATREDLCFFFSASVEGGFFFPPPAAVGGATFFFLGLGGPHVFRRRPG